MTDTTNSASDFAFDVPKGFKPLNSGEDGLFIGTNGPLYHRLDGDKFVMGMRVLRRHCNPTGNCHGGMLMTFIDMTLAIGANYQAKLGRFLPTINLAADYLAPAPQGSWIEGRMDVLRTTRSLVFAQCIVTADGVPVVRANGIYKIGREMPSTLIRGDSPG